MSVASRMLPELPVELHEHGRPARLRQQRDGRRGPLDRQDVTPSGLSAHCSRTPACRRRFSSPSHYIGFVQFIDPEHFPNVDVYAEQGSGIDTAVGIGLNELSPGQLLYASTPFFTRDGDVNQEDITNNAVSAWSSM